MHQRRKPVSRPRRIIDTQGLDDDAQVNTATVSREVGLSERTIRNLLSKKGSNFPRPLPKDGPGANYWRLGDVRAWLKSNRGRAALDVSNKTPPKGRAG